MAFAQLVDVKACDMSHSSLATGSMTSLISTQSPVANGNIDHCAQVALYLAK